MLEIFCHGSQAVVACILERAMELGARPAQAGEFTKRAFLAGKLDLTGVEAVADLIESQSAAAAKNAGHHCLGAMAEDLQQILTGIAGRPGIAASQTQIQGPAVPGPHLSIAHGVKRPLAHLPPFGGEKQVIGQSKGLGTADAADTDGPWQCTAGIGGDGIFHHGAFSFPMQKKGGGGVKAPRPSGSLGYWS